MALGFIKKIFSFGKDDKSAPAPEAAPVEEGVEVPPALPVDESPMSSAEPTVDPVTAEHLGDRFIVPDAINPRDFEDPRDDLAAELHDQAESVAEFNETIEEEPATAPAVIPPEEHLGSVEPTIEPETTTEIGMPVEAVADMDLGVEAEPAADEVHDAEASPAMEAELTASQAALESAPASEPEDESRSESAALAEPESTPGAEEAEVEQPAFGLETEPEPTAEAHGPKVTESAPPVDELRAAPVLPAGFASTSDRIDPELVTPERKLSWIERLRQGLSRTSAQLTSQITSLFTKRKLDDDTLQDLEDLLIQADLGVETALRITDALAAERYGKDVTGEDVSKIMASEITKVLGPVARPLELDLAHKPHVILVVGVNGTGKTTTIGKLAAKLTRGGLKVMLAAGDTFRAAAIEQLHIWASRTGADIVSSKLGADAAGLAYEAYEKAKQSGHDVLIIDTAGRLQNKTELMAELEKIVRVLGRLDPDAPHTVLQTLDATTGQNALNQVEIFRNIAGVSGLIMTKLDGTARGGILVAISAKHKLPVCFIGVGEGIEDLEPFNAKDFAEAIAGIQNK